MRKILMRPGLLAFVFLISLAISVSAIQAANTESVHFKNPVEGLEVFWNDGSSVKIQPPDSDILKYIYVKNNQSKPLYVEKYKYFQDLKISPNWSFKFNRSEVDQIWPLKVGNSVHYRIDMLRKDQTSTHDITLTVIRKQLLKLKFGTFLSYVVDEKKSYPNAVEASGYDTIRKRRWYVPA